MRRYQAVLLAVTGIVIAAIAVYVIYGSKPNGRGIALIGGPFSLTDHRGQPRTNADFKGRYMLIYFGYTFCPDVCPTSLQSMTVAMNQLAPAVQERITPIFITIDPERDTQSQIASYVENFHPRMVGLTGTADQIASTARAYRVYYGKAKDSESTTDYLVDHSSIIFLMDPEGAYITHFTHATSPQKMVEVMKKNIGS